MDNYHVTFRKVVVGGCCGLAGGIVGGTVVKFYSPSLPDLHHGYFLVVGYCAFLILAALIVPTLTARHRRAKQQD